MRPQSFIIQSEGTAAVEFSIILPVFLIILAGIVDIGLALNWKLAAESRLSSTANFILTKDFSFDPDDETTFLSEIGNFVSQTSIQNYSSQEDIFFINLNNSISLTISNGVSNQNNLPGEITSCYCPTEVNATFSWGNEQNCDTECQDGSSAARYATIMIENIDPLVFFPGFIFSPDLISTQTVVKLD